ncbi:cytochrome P450 [Aspergillus affinis]|uniref:cytochrome P450 n=1 Tax=Aspergillus affinis TaxID=1070780 RepID=UPI0022FE427F|nr:cytochrome P450 monooxygenase [Aspergillus affinis]KAI9041494.1 cytochrome P450 monooxygenase [Aspergillus affinis]
MAVLVDQTGTLVKALVTIVLLHVAGKAVYNVFFHPLRAFPGPVSHAMSPIPYCYRLLRGRLPFDMLALHEKYGDVVRIAPGELAFAHVDAWKDIHGHQSNGGDECGKWMSFYKYADGTPTSIANAEREEHGILRRQLSHGFSERSMRAQEPLITQYVDLLIRRLHEKCGDGTKSIDMASWYNFTTFDIIGDLAFGKPFGSLENSVYHPFIPLLLKSAKTGTLMLSLSFYPLLKKLFLAMVPKSVVRAFQDHRDVSVAKLRERMQAGNERDDLIEGLLRKQDELDLNMDRLEANGTILLIGGSETTATLLSGITYLLLQNPEVLARLTKEVRSSFQSEKDITMDSVNGLSYMLACLNEALRSYPPIPIGLPRVVPKNGRHIMGQYVAPDTIVAIHHWATYHNEKYFTDPFGFHPERFLGDERFANDNFDILQPFNFGPRNCLGRNLAYAEMRMILARLIFNFDLELASDSVGWMEQQNIFFLWDKPPLHVFLTPAKRS